ncbi:hypothetical protein BDK51DRAFT_41735 [Blyttiomyces helicus]|uniref:Uncharacterized protein n=1 Tax=Blyttiomyces helicus TaxID=388810 RepID=A0A4P9W8W6_9FUNG|nr:hypothetical protein BDK51DRAFT_41735 [Blyttiomyces helicus]|eukprot:RKO87538.1 hypothetical protein BDK51DRAFT_41735 [Blyttiomyces helicus]
MSTGLLRSSARQLRRRHHPDLRARSPEDPLQSAHRCYLPRRRFRPPAPPGSATAASPPYPARTTCSPSAAASALRHLLRWLRAFNGDDLNGYGSRSALLSCTHLSKAWGLIATEELWRSVDFPYEQDAMGILVAAISRGARSSLVAQALRPPFIRPKLLYWKGDAEQVAANCPNLKVPKGMLAEPEHVTAFAADCRHLASVYFAFETVTDDAELNSTPQLPKIRRARSLQHIGYGLDNFRSRILLPLKDAPALR